MVKVKVLGTSIKWSDMHDDRIVIKSKNFRTQNELDIFRKNLIKSNNFNKIIGVSLNVEYPIGYDCYAEENKNIEEIYYYE